MVPRKRLWGGINGIRRRRRWRRRGRLPTEITVVAAADYIDAATATIARCSTESDPLEGASCEVIQPTNWIYYEVNGMNKIWEQLLISLIS
jgi:hypothetical protein